MGSRSALLLLLMATLATSDDSKLLREYCERHIRNADSHVMEGDTCHAAYYGVAMSQNAVLDECESLAPFHVTNASLEPNSGFHCYYEQRVRCDREAAAVIGSLCYKRLIGQHTHEEAQRECGKLGKDGQLLIANPYNIRFLTSILPHEVFWAANEPYGSMRKANLIIGGEKMFDEKDNSQNAYALHTGFHVTLATRPGTMMQQFASRRLTALCQYNGFLSETGRQDLLERALEVYGGILQDGRLYTLSKSLYTPIVGADGKPNYDAMNRACQFFDESLESGILLPTKAEYANIYSSLMHRPDGFHIPEVIVPGYRGIGPNDKALACDATLPTTQSDTYRLSYHLLVNGAQYELAGSDIVVKNACNDYGSNHGVVFRIKDKGVQLVDAPTFIRTPIVCYAGAPIEKKTFELAKACSGKGSLFDNATNSCKCEDGYADEHDRNPTVAVGTICHACHDENHPLHVVMVLDYSYSMQDYVKAGLAYMKSWGTLAEQANVKFGFVLGNKDVTKQIYLTDFASAADYEKKILEFGHITISSADNARLLTLAAQMLQSDGNLWRKKNVIIHTGDTKGLNHPVVERVAQRVYDLGILLKVVTINSDLLNSNNPIVASAFREWYAAKLHVGDDDIYQINLDKVDTEIQALKADVVKRVCAQLT